MLLRHPIAAAYVVVAALLATIAAVLLALDTAAAEGVAVATVILLGPLGIVAALLGGFVGLFALGPLNPPDGALGVLLVALAVAVSTVNAWLVVRMRARRTLAAESEGPAAARLVRDRFVASVLFLVAGTGFVVLCFTAVFAVLMASSTEIASLPARTPTVTEVAAWIFLSGLVVALAGLVLWVLPSRRGRPALGWAIADVAFMLIANVVMVAVIAGT